MACPLFESSGLATQHVGADEDIGLYKPYP